MPVAVVAYPVDTTAAGDSFAAGYLAQRLAGIVIRHPGAIVARHAMAGLVAGAPAEAAR